MVPPPKAKRDRFGSHPLCSVWVAEHVEHTGANDQYMRPWIVDLLDRTSRPGRFVIKAYRTLKVNLSLLELPCLVAGVEQSLVTVHPDHRIVSLVAEPEELKPELLCLADVRSVHVVIEEAHQDRMQKAILAEFFAEIARPVKGGSNLIRGVAAHADHRTAETNLQVQLTFLTLPL